MRLFILLIMTLLIRCTPSQQSIIETFNASLDGRRDVTVTDGQIQALPYSTMYLRLDNGPRIRWFSDTSNRETVNGYRRMMR